jgi:hypothetical protein
MGRAAGEAAVHPRRLLARRLTARHLAAVSSVIAEQGLNIDIITRLSGRPRASKAPKPPNPRAPASNSRSAATE